VGMRELLRTLRVFDRPLPAFDPHLTPEHPDDMFAAWLREAVDAGVVEPHAMVLSTADADGVPDSRVVMLREVDERGWQYNANASSAKGLQLATNPVAALTFYWREQGRQVRVRGAVTRFGRDECDADFLARPVASRAADLAGEQSRPMNELANLDRAFTVAEELLKGAPQTTSASYSVYAVVPASVEFWQGDASRRHVRLRYRLTGDGWVKELLWP
jgi:pyridoxamine 5'-phosphate oxidase